MKGDDRMIEQLNARLKEELTATNQYFLHGEICANWRYERLHKIIEKRSIVEMIHAEKLIERILFLEGRPVVSSLSKVSIGSTVPEMLKNDLESGRSSVRAYNETIALAFSVRDDGTRELLESLLRDEEEHVDWSEAQLDEIDQTGLGSYLAKQIG